MDADTGVAATGGAGPSRHDPAGPVAGGPEGVQAVVVLHVVQQEEVDLGGAAGRDALGEGGEAEGKAGKHQQDGQSLYSFIK